MSTKSSHHEAHHNAGEQTVVPYWRRAHRSWIFWVGVALMFAAILTYVMSFDLMLRPRAQTAAPVPATTTP